MKTKTVYLIIKVKTEYDENEVAEENVATYLAEDCDYNVTTLPDKPIAVLDTELIDASDNYSW